MTYEDKLMDVLYFVQHTSRDDIEYLFKKIFGQDVEDFIRDKIVDYLETSYDEDLVNELYEELYPEE